ncbi:hypothetical protein PV327_003804 [Microctonus hyperodae]|uniref:receptor protein-tyrosine kinase n=1 Tax=Microctonus hyperodae TaxID=165561 RepID=A0AA39L1K0_MICHY|nr:hypothetical protein PV327_003804 [Microctonus hyperodae]
MCLKIVILFVFGYTTQGITLDGALNLAGCLVQCQNESCWDICNQNSSLTKGLTRLAITPNFNATLHCRDVDFLTLAHNPGIFVIEQSTINGSWNNVTVHNGSMSVFTNLLPDTSYRYRVHRVNIHGISQSEITDWFTTIKMTYQPKPIAAIAVKNIIPEDTNFTHLKAEIIFKPSEDRCCFYNILFWVDKNSLTNGYVNASNSFQFNLRGLEYNKNNTVIISAIHKGMLHNKNNVSLSFNTSTCLDVHKNISLCAPNKVDGLKVIYMHEFNSPGELAITWNIPNFLPDNYTIQIFRLNEMKKLKSITVPGNLTEAFYPIADNAYDQYWIGIIAESPGGSSPLVSIIRTFDNPRNTPSSVSHEKTMIIISSLTIGIIAVIFACIYFKCKRKLDREVEVKYRENFKDKVNHCTSYEKSLKSTSDSSKKSETELLIQKDDYEISPIDLNIKHVLGSGITGVVRLGLLRVNDNKSINVAVKMLKDCPSIDEVRCLQQEITIMKSAGTHQNIVSMIGCCTLNTKPMLVVEYCGKGDLQNYLRTIWKNILTNADSEARWKLFDEATYNNLCNKNNRPFLTHWNREAVSNKLYDIEQDTLKKTNGITAEDLLSFARQIANGMEYLSLNRIVHRDLAARNVLVCDDHIIKISDFGLSRDVYRENVYKKRGNEKLPLKWMAIEALTHQIYTTQSDVWSFGILLWEIVTLGSNPYPDIPTNAILQYLKSGKRMGKPSNCGEELFNIMMSCWRSSPRSRPTFTELKNSLDKLLLTVSDHEYVNFCDIVNELREENQD